MRSSQVLHAGLPQEEWLPSARVGGDAVMLVRRHNCIVNLTVRSLFRYLRPPPGRLHVISALAYKNCPQIRALHPRILCHDESSILPGLNASSVANALEKAHLGSLKHLGGWYLQQFLKLAFATSALRTSAAYLVWDSDTVLVRPYAPILLEQQQSRRARPKLRILVGGWSGGNAVYAEGLSRLLPRVPWYRSAAYGNLTAVMHQALFYSPWVLELLSGISRTSAGGRGKTDAEVGSSARLPLWASRSLLAMAPPWPPTKPSWKLHGKLFSEYGFYASWVMHHHASDVIAEPSFQCRLRTNHTAPCPDERDTMVASYCQPGRHRPHYVTFEQHLSLVNVNSRASGDRAGGSRGL